MGKFVAIYGVVAIVLAIVAGIVAATKRRDYSYWMTVTFLFPVMILVLFFLPANTGPRPKRPTMEEEDDREYARSNRS